MVNAMGEVAFVALAALGVLAFVGALMSRDLHGGVMTLLALMCWIGVYLSDDPKVLGLLTAVSLIVCVELYQQPSPRR